MKSPCDSEGFQNKMKANQLPKRKNPVLDLEMEFYEEYQNANILN